ncbi:hypothetical protein F5Y19DRAFT_493578 [Xylariaceae sp. FL1651]|nr:hypothetical protein F5Y19DRAFT_493578 [Xylariaceae sp. FL1651]
MSPLIQLVFAVMQTWIMKLVYFLASWISASCLVVFERVSNPSTMTSMLAWISSVLSISFDQITNFAPTRALVSWVSDIGLLALRHIADHIVPYLAQSHVMHKVHQTITTVAAIWFFFGRVTAFLNTRSKHAVRGKAITDHKRHSDVSNPEHYIFQLLKELVANCDTHSRRILGEGCHLKNGAESIEIHGLDQLLSTDLPADYKTFLQLTNGLTNIWDGSGYSITFLPFDSVKWTTMYPYTADPDPGGLCEQYLIDSIIGTQCRMNLVQELELENLGPSIRPIRIATHPTWMGCLLLITQEQVREAARYWAPIVMGLDNLTADLVGMIFVRTEDYFGGTDIFNLLEEWDGWLLLQVHSVHDQLRCRIYPSFTAYLEELTEMTRRETTELMVGVDEAYFADSCRWRWEWMTMAKGVKEQHHSGEESSTLE